MLKRLSLVEDRYDALLIPYRKNADRIMLGMNCFLLLVCFGLAPLRDTWLAVAAIGLPTLALGASLVMVSAGRLVTRIFMACAFMAFTGLIIHQTGGDIEGHFSAFGLIGVLLYYRDWRTIFAATVFIYLHHLVLGFAQTRGVAIYVFDSDLFWSTLAIHIAYFLPFVVMMGYLSIWLRREAYEAQHVIELAGQIMRGDLMKTPEMSISSLETPLISAVVSMRDRLLDLMRVLPVPAVIVRMDTHAVVAVNRSWESQCAGIPDEHTPFGDCPVWPTATVWQDLLAAMQARSGRILDKVEVTMVRRDGTQALCELSLILLEEAEPVMAIVTAEDITQRRQTEQAMRRLAFSDMLTDLPNRASLQHELEAAFLRFKSVGDPFAVLMMDLDGFKPINDSLGHDAGDEALQIIAQRIRHINRSDDFAARLGGDEFVVLLPNCGSVDEAGVVARRFVKAISTPIRLDRVGEVVNIGVSVGVAHCDQGAATAEEILRQADGALYRAKHSGRGTVAVHDPAFAGKSVAEPLERVPAG